MESEKRKDQKRLWKQNNKDKVKKSDRQYYLRNKEIIKSRNKKWREDNRDYARNYYILNKDKILTRLNERRGKPRPQIKSSGTLSHSWWVKILKWFKIVQI